MPTTQYAYNSPMKHPLLTRLVILAAIGASLMTLPGCVIYPPDIRIPFPIVIGHEHGERGDHHREHDED